MILARTLRRTILMNGELPNDCVAFLHADPLLPSPTERTDIVIVEPRDDGLFSMRCSWGRDLTGSARALARDLDDAMFGLAASDEGSAPSLNASVFRLHGTRIVLVADKGTNLSELSVALLVSGAAYEGMGLVFIRASGIVAHPVKPRLRLHHHTSGELSPLVCRSPFLDLDFEGAYCAIDPRAVGVEWSVMEGPVPIFIFVERNDGGHSAIARLRSETALTSLMRCIRSAYRPDVQTFIRCRALVEKACSFHMTAGTSLAAADLILAQVGRYAS